MAGRNMVRRAMLAAVAVMGMAGLPNAASAGVVTYTPNPADIYDLDHHYTYTWKIGGINIPTGETVTGATLVFTNLYNWDTNPNRLFLHLLDTARYNGVAQYQDAPLNQTPVTTISDEFTESHTGDSAWIVNAGTADTFLTSRSFAALGGHPDLAPGQPNPAGWSYVASGTRGGKQLYTYTYTFTKAQAATIGTYINNSTAKNIAIGLDPDCHFYNDGIKLNIAYGKQPVPEPASLALFALAGLAVARRMRSKARD